MTIHDRIEASSGGIDWLARRQAHKGTEHAPASRGWEPGAFSRVGVSFTPVDDRGRRHKLVGWKTGFMTVLGHVAHYHVKGWCWVCRCNCGNYVLARARRIRHQSVRMCGECEDVYERAGHMRPERKNEVRDDSPL